MPLRGKESYSIQSVENALDLLEALSEEVDEIRISRLSEKLNMNKTSVFRLLATLENRGYVEREQESGKYRLGLSAYEIGQKFLARMNLLGKARPVMERLARQCGEAIYLVIFRDLEVLFFDQVDTLHQVKIVSLVGNRYAVTATAAGRVILAHQPEEVRNELRTRLTERGLPVPTEQDLAEIRTRQHCADHGEIGEGIATFCVPLFSAGGKLPASLCLVGPDFRVTPDLAEQTYLPLLLEAGETVSSKLGCFNHYPRQTS